MNFEIDVSGSDILAKDYTIVVAKANTAKLVLAHKFSDKSRKIFGSRHGQGDYRYPVSRKGKADLRLRLYCVAIYYLFRELKKRHRLKELSMDVCRDFSGNEADIKVQLKSLLEKRLRLKIAEMNFVKLSKESVADNYAFLIRHDKHNEFAKYCLPIKIAEFEIFLKNQKNV